jgi:hypothetical protein
VRTLEHQLVLVREPTEGITLVFIRFNHGHYSCSSCCYVALTQTKHFSLCFFVRIESRRQNEKDVFVNTKRNEGRKRHHERARPAVVDKNT